ncbi:MAG: hypothetical protein AB7V46_21735 [Thermomicrobiales bacterium]
MALRVGFTLRAAISFPKLAERMTLKVQRDRLNEVLDLLASQDWLLVFMAQESWIDIDMLRVAIRREYDEVADARDYPGSWPGIPVERAYTGTQAT